MVWLSDARLPADLRIYALGDVHGCLDPLVRRIDAIEADLAAHPAADWRVVLLGDLIDRGPDSPGVLDWLAARMAADRRLLCVRGNHDTYLAEFIDDPLTESFRGWASYGGAATMAQYGIDPARIDPDLRAAERRALHADLAARVPGRHVDLIRALPLTLRFGDFLFVHGGIRPDVAIAEQAEDDLIWMREPFLSWRGELPCIVVHGHTPSDTVEARPHRIGIDTGLVFGGDLSCLVLEGGARWLLNDEGRASLPGPA